jgi:hypothetical protein
VCLRYQVSKQCSTWGSTHWHDTLQNAKRFRGKRKSNVIYTHKRSTTFPAPAIMRLTNAKQKSVPIHYSEFRHNATTYVESTDRNSFDGPKKTKILNPHRFLASALRSPQWISPKSVRMYWQLRPLMKHECHSADFHKTRALSTNVFKEQLYQIS